MKRSSIIVAVAAVLATLVATTAAFASGPKDNTLYRYVGQVKAAGETSVTVTVQNGNRAALRSLLGKDLEQTFATDEKTVFLRWTDGKPAVIKDLKENDYVTVNVRSDRKADIGTITKKPAASVGNRGQTLNKPTQPLYLFRGTLVSAADGKVTIVVRGGNRHALKLMIGQASAQQTFATGTETVFLYWAKRIPAVIDFETLSKKPAGDRIVIRVRADRGSALEKIKQTPARRVADREPKASEANQSNQS
jgi:hypothetical protein